MSCGGGGGSGAASVGTSTIALQIGDSGLSAKATTGQDTFFANVLNLVTPNEAEAGGSIVIDPDPDCAIPLYVRMIRFIIEGDGMATITRDVPINPVNGDCVVIETFEVPNGPSRNFIAFAFDVANSQTHSGNTVETVPAPDNYVPIYLDEDRGCDLYVDIINNVGDLSNDCTDPSEPCETITHALDPAQTPLGDETICVFPGVYRPAYEGPGETYPLFVDRSIKLLCVDDNLNLNQFRGCFLDGEIFQDEVYEPEGVVISDTATISNFTIQHFPKPSGQFVDTGVNVVSGEPTVRNNNITENVTGLAVFGGNPHIRNNIISRNDQGIVIFPGIGAGHDITNNTIACNNSYDLFSNQSSGTINVPGNRWDHVPPEEFARQPGGCPANSDDICYDAFIGDVTVNVDGALQSQFLCGFVGDI